MHFPTSFGVHQKQTYSKQAAASQLLLCSCSQCPWTSVHTIWKKLPKVFLFVCFLLFFSLKQLLQNVCWRKEQQCPCRRNNGMTHNQSPKLKSTPRVDLPPAMTSSPLAWSLHDQHLSMCTLKFTTMATTANQDQLGIYVTAPNRDPPTNLTSAHH